MGKITNTKIEQTDDEKQQFYRELEVITQLAETLEQDEQSAISQKSTYNAVINVSPQHLIASFIYGGP